MGSYSASTSIATDNRLAVTDNGFGLSSSGTGNNTALKGHILNVNQIGGQGYKGTGGASGGDVNVNILDGGSIDKAFDFAAFSLSETLGAIIGNTRQAEAQQQNTMETIGAAITQASTTTQEATQAAGAAMVENQKILFTFAIIAGAGYWLFFRGKK